MKFSLSPLLPAIIASSMIDGALGSCFTDTCDDNTISLQNGEYLVASCKNEAGAYVDSVLDLNDCYWNDKGVLKDGDDGEYADSCGYCSIVPNGGGLYLVCDCDNASGHPQTEINMCNAVWNNDGRLDCYGHVGTVLS